MCVILFHCVSVCVIVCNLVSLYTKPNQTKLAFSDLESMSVSDLVSRSETLSQGQWPWVKVSDLESRSVTLSQGQRPWVKVSDLESRSGTYNQSKVIIDQSRSLRIFRLCLDYVYTMFRLFRLCLDDV